MNTYIKCLYSPGFSFVMLSFYKTNLSLGFTPWAGQDKNGSSNYDRNRFLSTTINDEHAASLYYLVTKIVEGTSLAPVQCVISCNKDTTLTFEYNAEKATLVIEKQKEKIVFEFRTFVHKTKENGKIIEKVIQSGLIVFQQALTAYLTAIAAEHQRYGSVDELYPEPQTQSFISGW